MSKTNVVVTRDTVRTLPPLLFFGLFFVSVSVVEFLGTLSVMDLMAAIIDLLTETSKGYVVNHNQYRATLLHIKLVNSPKVGERDCKGNERGDKVKGGCSGDDDGVG